MTDASAAAEALRALALSWPETREDFPWGESAFKVNGKGFCFLYFGPEYLSVSMKLPLSFASALERPDCVPTGYGLGRHGWITARFPPDAHVPLEMLKGWLEESYRAVAPKRLLKVMP